MFLSFTTLLQFIFSLIAGAAAGATATADAPVAEPAAAITAPAPTVADVPAPAPAPVVAPTPATPEPSIGIPGLSAIVLGNNTMLPGIIAQNSKAQPLTADVTVDRVQGFYRDTKHLTALFRQTVTNSTFGRKTVSDGKVYIKKPGKMRWDYTSKKNKKRVNKSFISDGNLLWAVFHDDKQLYKKNVKDDLLPVAITFLSGQGDLRRDFLASLDSTAKYGKKSDIVLKLIPKKPNAQYKALWLVVDSGNFRVRESVVLNAKGDTNHFQFFSPNTTAQVKDSYFTFNEKAFKNFRIVEPDDAPTK